MDIPVAKSCVVRPHPDSPNVLLVFSAIDITEGDFLGFRTIFTPEKFNATIIFLNDYRKCWYMRGIPGLGDDLETTLEKIAGLIATHRGNNGALVAYGNSMGAFGALLYGCRLDVDVVIAPGVEILTKNPLGISQYYLKQTRGRLDMKSIVAKSKAFCHLVAGEHFFGDIIGLYRLSGLPNVFIETVRNFEHGVSAYIHLTQNITHYINEYIKMAAKGTISPRSLVEKSHIGNIIQEKKIGIYLYSTNIMISFNKGNYKNRINKLLSMVKMSKNIVITSYINFTVAILYMKTNQKLTAILYATKAHHLHNGSPHITQFLSSIYYNDKDYELCYAWSRKSIALRKRFPASLYKDNSCYYECVESLCALGLPAEGARLAEKYLSQKHIPEEKRLRAALEACRDRMRTTP